jgi:hypothetical protein
LNYRKNTLLQEIRQLNDQFSKTPLYTEDFRQKYAWTAIQLQATNSVIEPVLTMFRFRSIKPEFLSLYQSSEDPPLTNSIIENAEELFSNGDQKILKNYAVNYFFLSYNFPLNIVLGFKI